MRAAWMLLAFSLALPAAAAERTETFRLRYLPVTEADRIFFQPRDSAAGGLGGGLGGAALVPEGLAAWSVDARAGTVTVTGTEQALGQVRDLLRLLDVPLARVRLSLRVLEVGPEALRELGLQAMAQHELAVRTALLEPDAAARLAGQAKRTLAAAEPASSNNLPVRLRWTAAPGRSGAADVTPRVNGDGTVTLFLPARAFSAAPAPGVHPETARLAGAGAVTVPAAAPLRDGLLAIRRLGVGQTAATMTPSGLVFLVSVLDVEVSKPGKRRR